MVEVPTAEEHNALKDAIAAARKLGEDALEGVRVLAERVASLEAQEPEPEPVKATLFGYNLTSTSSLAGLQATIGDPRVIRMFFSGTPGPSDPVWALGKVAVVSFKFDPTRAFPADRLRAFLANKPEGLKAYVCTYHEPEDNITRNEFTSAQYRAFVTATTQVCREFEDCYSTPILMQWTLDERSGRNVDDYLTGTEYDVLGWDVYPRSGTIGDIANGLQEIHDESVKRDKPWLIGEVGAGSWIEERSPVPFYSEAERAAWMLRTVEQIKALATRPEAVCWFLYPTGGAGFPLNSPETQAAMRQILS